MFKLSYFFLILTIILFSCKDAEDDESQVVTEVKPVVENSVKEIEKEILEEQKLEVYRIENKAVIFFIISKGEAQTLANEIGEIYRWETEALLNGFVKQAESFRKILPKHNIQCNLSNNKRYEIILKKGKIVTFDRVKEDQIMGEILTNGEKQPLICYGMYRNSELADLIKEYFNIKDLGYIEPDSLTTGIKTEPMQDSIN